MYNKVSELNLPNEEQKILNFWAEHDIKNKCLNMNKGAKVFSFFEGPPTANGQPHAGHVLTRALKDVFTRYKSMKGFFVPRKGGWDTHGLPVEIAVEKEIGISGKKEIEAYGVNKFIDACKKDVWKYVDLWKTFSNRIGYNINMEDDYYVTYHDEYIESIWWSLKELDKKGLLYKGYKVQPSCPQCGTSLSSHEVAQGYKERKDTTVVAKFKSIDEENTYFLAWTTTPWTLPSNIALCVNPNEKYVKLNCEGVNYILAEALINNHFKDREYNVVAEYIGKDLEYKKYVPLFDFLSKDEQDKGYYVTCDNYVTLTDGTGIVHIAPGYGEDDANVGRKYGLPFVQLADKYGKFTANCGKYAGLDVFETNEKIADDLREDGKIFKTQKHVHEYPHCWRCKSPLMYFARDGWFVKTTAIKDILIKNNQGINWFPDTIKNGRMGGWLENVIDWGISRDRYWGTPLPVWKCECGHYHVVGSKAELKELGGLKQDVELHKPYVDEVKIKCDKCGKMMSRESEVIDAWYDSGSMPFAQFHYPFENKEEFERRFPADFIGEGQDQCRGWFYTMQVLGAGLFGKAPFKNCLVNGMVVDDNGVKLSKSLGNYRPPMEIINESGADAVRWSFYTGNQPWNSQVMTVNSARETIKRYFGTLWNTYAFFVLYAEIDKFDPSKYSLDECKLSVMDRWIICELNKLIKDVSKHLDEFHVTEASRIMQEFVDKLSNWYVRCGRERYWGSEFSEDKKSAYMTLWYVLTTYAKLSAPFTPFMSETIYQNLVVPFFGNVKESIHLCEYPEADEGKIDEKLSEDMSLVYSYTELGRGARNSANIKNRQPLQTMYLTDTTKTSLDEDMLSILKKELNVKNVIQNEDLSRFVNYNLKPQLKTLGPKYGKLINEIREFLANCDTSVVMDEIKKNGIFKQILNNEEVEFTENDLLVSVGQKEGYCSSVDDNLGVILDTKLTDELIEEGIVREFVSRVQNLRKSSNFVVTDRIIIEVCGDEWLQEVIEKYTKEIKEDVLAVDVKVGNKGMYSEEFELANKKLTTFISKA